MVGPPASLPIALIFRVEFMCYYEKYTRINKQLYDRVNKREFIKLINSGGDINVLTGRSDVEAVAQRTV